MKKLIAAAGVAVLLGACGGGGDSGGGGAGVVKMPEDYGRFLGSHTPEKRDAGNNPVDNAAVTCVLGGNILTVVQDGEVKGTRSMADLGSKEKIDLDQQGGPAEYYCRKVTG